MSRERWQRRTFDATWVTRCHVRQPARIGVVDESEIVRIVVRRTASITPVSGRLSQQARRCGA